MVKDINGKRLKAGDMVRRARRGSDVIPVKRRSGKGALPPMEVLHIGRTGTPLDGYICVDNIGGFRLWERPNNFERISV